MTIHQEALIDATPLEVYAYLTEGETFAAATGTAARLEPWAGSAFSLFGGRVEGRLIELVPGRRVVQAWRFGDAHPDAWDAGVYSIVRFTLTVEGDRTRLVVDHDAIPAEWCEHIESGYPTFYQEPMARYFAQRHTAQVTT
jgi:activator of HSP90 ATPase